MFFTIYIICTLLLTGASFYAFRDGAFEPIISSGVYTEKDIFITLLFLTIIPVINFLTLIYLIYLILYEV